MSDAFPARIPYTHVRVGASEGLFFLGADLSTDSKTRDRLLVAAVESYSRTEVKETGSGNEVTRKVAVISPSWRKGIDVEYLYTQVSSHHKPSLDAPTDFGDLLAGVGPVAIARGMVTARDGVTPVSIYSVNMGRVAVTNVPTPKLSRDHDAKASMVSSHQPSYVRIDFIGTVGAMCGALLPTGRVTDTLGMYRATLIDNGTPLVVIPASDLGKSGHEPPSEIDSDARFGVRAEELRRAAGQLMKLGDVRSKIVPKMTFVSAAEREGHISAFTLARQKFEPAISAFEAITIGAACALPGSIPAGLVVLPDSTVKRLSVGHPAGECSVELELESIGSELKVLRSSLISVVQVLSVGEILLSPTDVN